MTMPHPFLVNFKITHGGVDNIIICVGGDEKLKFYFVWPKDIRGDWLNSLYRRGNSLVINYIVVKMQLVEECTDTTWQVLHQDKKKNRSTMAGIT